MDDEPFLGAAEADPAPELETKPFTPDQARGTKRGQIAIGLILLLAATIVASFVLLWKHPEYHEELHQLLTLIFSPLKALVGTVTGYYFSSQSANKP